MASVLLTSSSSAANSSSNMISLVFSLVLIFVVFYFFMLRPQKKEQQKKDLMLNEVAIGDTILTSSGFYGVVIGLEDDTVIVEFGNNKNCRIPMQKTAIAAVEKPEDSKAE